ncbi:hypothetical protein [Streptomyces sp. NPDC088707]|uniref:hypothetical protein n=1 Tax=Streptomyces sp. NPDC088707 TaxID=3365871 RepID=UPI0038037EA7
MSEVQWHRLTAAELRDHAAWDAAVLLPIGATQRHWRDVHDDGRLPGLIHTERLAEAHGLRTVLPLESTEPVLVAVTFARVTGSVVAWDARATSPEKGERLLSRCARALADIIVRDPWEKDEAGTAATH